MSLSSRAVPEVVRRITSRRTLSGAGSMVKLEIGTDYSDEDCAVEKSRIVRGLKSFWK
jgi:hypothetical protein